MTEEVVVVTAGQLVVPSTQGLRQRRNRNTRSHCEVFDRVRTNRATGGDFFLDAFGIPIRISWSQIHASVLVEDHPTVSTLMVDDAGRDRVRAVLVHETTAVLVDVDPRLRRKTGLPVVESLEVDGGQHQTPAVARQGSTEVFGKTKMVSAAPLGCDDEQGLSGLVRVREVAFHQTRILRESTGGNNDGARRHLDVVGDNADNPTVFLDQLLHPCSEDDLDPVLTTSLVQHLNQSVSLILGHVAAPDVLDAGLGESPAGERYPRSPRESRRRVR